MEDDKGKKTSASRPSMFVRQSTGLTRSIGPWSALMGNSVVIGIAYMTVFAFFVLSLYPGADLPLTVLVSFVPLFIWCGVYYLMNMAMPRTGGDYVWVSRAVHPLAGLVGNFMYAVVLVTTNAVVAAWLLVYGIGPMLVGLALPSNNQSLIKVATDITTLPTSFLLSLVILSIFIIPLFFSTKTVFRVIWILALVAIFSALFMAVVFFATPNTQFIANFNHLSGMNYSQTISLAGLPLGFSLGATLTGTIFAITNLAGQNNSSYFAGEIKQQNRSQMIAIFGSIAFVGTLVVVVYASAYSAMGPNFLNALSSLAATASPKYVLPVPPVLNFLVVFANPNPIVVIIASLALIVTSLASIVGFTFSTTRMIFAWSFDSLLPHWVAKVDDKRGSPYMSVIVIWIFSLLCVVVYYYTSFFTYYIYSAILIVGTFGFACLGAILFPSGKTRGIFNQSTPLVKKTILGIPIIRLLGIAGLISAALLIYASLLPSVTPAVSGSPLIKAISYAIVPFFILMAVVIYFVAHYYWKSKGIDLRTTVFSEIPPE